MQKINVGIIGYGMSAATFHAPLLAVLDGFNIVKVISSQEDKVFSDLKPIYSQIKVEQSLDSLTQDSNVELIIITTPSGTHFDIAKSCLLAGKHVIIEKPMVVKTSEADELIQLANEKGLLLSVYQNRRWDNDFVTVKKLVQDGNLGSIHTYQVHYDRFKPNVIDRWRERNESGSGLLYDLGSHLIDQALHLFGWPKFVIADVATQRKGAQTDDYFHIILGYENTRAILHAGTLVLGNGPRFQVHGDQGSYIKYGLDGQEAKLKAGIRPFNESFGIDDPKWYGTLTTEQGEQQIPSEKGSYLEYYKGIYQCLREGQAAPVTAVEGLNVIKIIESARESSVKKQTIFV